MLHRLRAPLRLFVCVAFATVLSACGPAGEDADSVTASAGSVTLSADLDRPRHGPEAKTLQQAGAGPITAAAFDQTSEGETSSGVLASAGLRAWIDGSRLGEFARGAGGRTFLRINRGQPVEGLDPNKPTIVLTHGWQPFPAVSYGDTPSLFNELSDGLRSLLGESVNIVEFHWEDAYTTIIFRPGVTAGLAGQRLVEELAAVLPPAYVHHIHLIGHSHGTVVNATALDNLEASGIRVTQVTMLDAPSRFGIEELTGQAGGYGAEFFNPIYDRSNVLFIDNHFGTGVFAFGEPIPGAHNLPSPDANHFSIARHFVDRFVSGAVYSVTQFPAGEPQIPLYTPQIMALLHPPRR